VLSEEFLAVEFQIVGVFLRPLKIELKIVVLRMSNMNVECQTVEMKIDTKM
jgi:hypothetical protein